MLSVLLQLFNDCNKYFETEVKVVFINKIIFMRSAFYQIISIIIFSFLLNH